MGGVAEFERAMIRERQREGIAKAKEAGKYTGRKSATTETQLRATRERATAGANKSALTREFCITRQTVHNILAA
jgi:DNA invertase Pin-like site-specific DNA recombinase